MTDAFAEAAAAQSAAVPQSAPVTAAVQAPVGNPIDLDNPWATSSEIVTGSSWDPRVPFEDILGRTVVMIARSYDPAAKNPFYKDGEPVEKMTREEFKVDLVIIDGEPFSFDIEEKDPNDPNRKVYKTINIDTLPHVSRGQGIPWGGLVGKLKAVTGLPARNAPKTQFTTMPRLFVGAMSYAPYATAARKGKTIDHVTEEMREWIARGRKGTEPEHTWMLDDRPHVFGQMGDPANPRVKAMNAWYAEYRKTL